MRVARNRKQDESANYDLTISDLMAALVLIFILLLSTQFLEIKKQSTLASEYRDQQQALIMALKSEFENDLEAWSAEIDEKTLVIRFRDSDSKANQVGFDPESAVLKERFKAILDDFFPRYINVLTDPKFKGEIEEVRIEGHTANPDGRFSTKKGYSDSIWLSQERANNVLFHVLGSFSETTQGQEQRLEWVRTHIAASGFAFAKPLVTPDGNPDWLSSRRVEFKIRTNYEQVIQKLIDVTEGKSDVTQ
jgi:outer membrane protein OmpA-like peptidoglycan-associated protein